MRTKASEDDLHIAEIAISQDVPASAQKTVLTVKREAHEFQGRVAEADI
jgi:hypothetical protein